MELCAVQAQGCVMELETAQIKASASAIAIALFVLAVVAFAPGVFHNAAHDVRHAFAVPCH